MWFVQWDVEVMPQLASLHQGSGQQTPAGSTLGSRRAAAGAAAALVQPAYQLDVCLPRLRVSSHRLMPLEVWLVGTLFSSAQASEHAELKPSCERW